MDQKAVWRQFVATLTQLPPNVKDIKLAALPVNWVQRLSMSHSRLTPTSPKDGHTLHLDHKTPWMPLWNKPLVSKENPLSGNCRKILINYAIDAEN